MIFGGIKIVPLLWQMGNIRKETKKMSFYLFSKTTTVHIFNFLSPAFYNIILIMLDIQSYISCLLNVLTSLLLEIP